MKTVDCKFVAKKAKSKNGKAFWRFYLQLDKLLIPVDFDYTVAGIVASVLELELTPDD